MGRSAVLHRPSDPAPRGRFLPAAAALTVACAAATAQSFAFPNFSSVAQLTLNGTAAQSGVGLRLTNSAAQATGSAFYSQAVPVTDGFDTRFQFTTSSAPEGLAFVVHGAPSGAQALGGGLWGIGYGFGVGSNPISNSLAIEIDGTFEGFVNDTGPNEVSIHTTGIFGNTENESVSIGRVTPLADLTSNVAHTLRINYVPGTLEIYIDDMVTPVLTTAYTLENGGTQLTGGNTGGLGLAGGQAYVGFTAANPVASGQFVEVQSWSWVSQRPAHPCYLGNVGVGAGGPFDVLFINSSNGGFYRNVQLFGGDPFTLRVVPPPGVSQAPFLVFLALQHADATTVTNTIAGLMCFAPVLPLDFGSVPAPLTVPIPAGLVLPPNLTIQAGMVPDPNNPSVLALTNAISLDFTPASPPIITAVSPNSAVPGNTITITGSAFSPFATLDINSVPVPVATVTPQRITFAMPAGLPCGSTLTVHNPDAQSATVGFNPTPVITATFNNTGPVSGGTSIVFQGTGFAPGCTATVGGNPAIVSTASASVVVVMSPAGVLGPAPVVVTTPGGCSVSGTFTYQ